MRIEKPRVLFGEIGQRWAELAGAKLRRAGLGVRYANSVSRMLGFLETSDADLIVLDQDLAGPKWAALVELLGRRAGEAKLILVTPPGTQVERGISKVWAHLWKPVDLGLFLSAAESALGISLAQAPQPAAHIVCVDDDSLFLAALERILTRHDYQVTCFRDPCCVVEALPHLSPDLVILDVRMPALDGCRLARAIQELDRHGPPLLFLSGRLPQEDAPEDVAPSGITWLSKPAEPELVLATVDRLLEQSALTPSALAVLA